MENQIFFKGPLQDEEATLSHEEYVQRALEKPEYIKPHPRSLPPISAKNAAFAATTASLLSPVVPELDSTKRPEEVNMPFSSTSADLSPVTIRTIVY